MTCCTVSTSRVTHDEAVANILFGKRSMFANLTDSDWEECVKKAS